MMSNGDNGSDDGDSKDPTPPANAAGEGAKAPKDEVAPEKQPFDRAKSNAGSSSSSLPTKRTDEKTKIKTGSIKGQPSGTGPKEGSKEEEEDKSPGSKENENAQDPGFKEEKISELALNIEDSLPEEDVMFTHVNTDNTFSIWSIDFYYDDKFRDVNIILRSIPWVIIYTFVLLSVPLAGYVITEKTIDLEKFFNGGYQDDDQLEALLRRNLYVDICFVVDIAFYIVIASCLTITGAIITILGLYNSTICWSFARSIYQRRQYARMSLTLLFAFYLSLRMYGPYSRPGLAWVIDLAVFQTFVLWGGIYMGMLFIAAVVVNIATFGVRRSAYSETIFNLNNKAFVFLKLHAIAYASANGESEAEVIEQTSPEFDDGVYLKYRETIFPSIENAREYATDIYSQMDKTELKLKDIKRFFPQNYKDVYKYLAGVSVAEDDSRTIKLKQFVSLAEELYGARKDMERTLKGRDTVYEKLEFIFSLIITYVAFGILLMLFRINAKVFMASFGTSLLTFSWIFADTIKNIFQCFVFLLIIRPFNIGDRVEVNDETLYVCRIDLLTTTFYTPCKKIVYISNVVLVSARIYNIARSSPQSEMLTINVDEYTTFEQARALEKTTSKLIEKKKSLFTSCRFMEITEGCIKYKIGHKSNFQNDDQLRSKHTKIIVIFKRAMSEVGIKHKDSFSFKI